MTTARRRMRSASVRLGVTALVAAALTGCSQGADNQAICVDPEEKVRVDDDECDDSYEDYDDDDYHGVGGSSGYYWFYMPSGSRAPAVGSNFSSSSGTYDSSSLSGSVKKGGVDTSGGTIKRGGFGGGGFSSS